VDVVLEAVQVTAGFNGGVTTQPAMTVIAMNEVDLEGRSGCPFQHFPEIVFFGGNEHMGVLGRSHVKRPPDALVTEPHFDKVGPAGGAVQPWSKENEPWLVEIGEGPFDSPAHQGACAPSQANLEAAKDACVG